MSDRGTQLDSYDCIPPGIKPSADLLQATLASSRKAIAEGQAVTNLRPFEGGKTKSQGGGGQGPGGGKRQKGTIKYFDWKHVSLETAYPGDFECRINKLVGIHLRLPQRVTSGLSRLQKSVQIQELTQISALNPKLLSVFQPFYDR